MKVPIEQLETLFEKLLFELNINEPDMFEEFNLCLNYAVVPGSRRVAQFSHILKNTQCRKRNKYIYCLLFFYLIWISAYTG